MTESGVYDVVYRSADAVRTAHETELKHGGGFVPSPEPPDALTRVLVRYHLPKGAPHVDVHAKVVNVVSGGCFVQFEPGDEYEALLSAVEFVRALESSVVGLDDDVSTPPVVAGGGAEAPPADAKEPPISASVTRAEDGPAAPLAGVVRPAWELIDLGSDVPLTKQLAELTIPEKTRLARHANRPVRALLIRDPEKRLHLEVVKNPKARQEEFLEWSALPSVSPQALRWISKDRRLGRIPQLQLNLVKNPSTPREVALRYIKTLPVSELRKIVRSSTVREAIARAARKRIMTEDA